MSASARRQQISRMTQELGFCSIRDFGEALGVSEMTIRRDVVKLSARGVLHQVFGGVTRLSDPSVLGTDYRIRLRSHALEKKLIGARAAQLIPKGAVVAIDSGTTALAVAQNLAFDVDATVVTASLPAINHLRGVQGVEVVVPGGILRPELEAFAGPLTLASIKQLRVSIFFVGASGVCDDGIYCANQFDVLTKRALIKSAQKVILLADSSKFVDITAMMQVAELDSVDTVIVDSGIPEFAQEYLRAADVTVIEVKAEDEKKSTPKIRPDSGDDTSAATRRP